MRCPSALSRLVAGLGLTVLLSPAAGAQTFVERLDADDLRVVSYNVLWDTIFPSEDPVQAAKFERVLAALDADVWCLQEIDFGTPLQDVLDLFDDLAPIPGGWQGYKVGDCVTLSRWPLSMKQASPTPEGDKDLAMCLVDLPDDRFSNDLYVMNNHYKCCGGFDDRRQEQSDALVNWQRDARTPGGFITLPAGTAMMVIGDLNIVDGFQPAQTLIDGDIQDESTFGPDSPPDWDGSDSTDVRPLHNVTGPEDWTWFTPGPFPPGRLDFVITTDSVLTQVHSYALNTTTMSASELAATGLQANDVTIDQLGQAFDHIPLVVDYRGDVTGPSPWTLLGGALAGVLGEPTLEGLGTLQGGDPVSLVLDNGRPVVPATLVLGLSELSAPFKGGTLVPAPDLLIAGLTTNFLGDLVISDTWPTGLPAGLSFWVQIWVHDDTGPAGFTATNGVMGTTP